MPDLPRSWLIIALGIVITLCALVLVGLGLRAFFRNRNQRMQDDNTNYQQRNEVGGRGGVAAVVEAHQHQIRRLEEDVRRLRGDVEELKRAAANPRGLSQPDAVSQSRFEAGSQQPAPPPREQSSSQMLTSKLGELERDYAATAGNPKALSAFANRYEAVNFENGRLTGDSGASFVWAIPLAPRFYALLPGYDLTMDFAVNYSSERSIPDTVKQAFDFEINQTRSLRLLRAGVANVASDGSLNIAHRGLIAGLSD